MDAVRIFATLFFVIVIALLSVFQMQIRGFEKVERINEWVLYYNSEQGEDVQVIDVPVEYYKYTVKQGFEEKNLAEVYANEHELFTQVEWQDIDDLVNERELE